MSIEGTNAADSITLRLKAGDPSTLQVDVGDNGSANFNFARDKINAITVDASSGNDLVRVDESNGVFTDAIRDHPRRRAGRRQPVRRLRGGDARGW